MRLLQFCQESCYYKSKCNPNRKYLKDWMQRKIVI